MIPTEEYLAKAVILYNENSSNNVEKIRTILNFLNNKGVILYNENSSNNVEKIRTILNFHKSICDNQNCALGLLWVPYNTTFSKKGFIDRSLNLSNNVEADASRIWFTNRSLNLENLTKADASRIWFTNRSLNLENPSIGDIDKEDSKCTAIGQSGKCSYSEISNIKEKISLLDNSSFLVNFHNEGKKIHSIQEPIENFVSALNHFFVLFVIAGPNIFLVLFKRHLEKSKID